MYVDVPANDLEALEQAIRMARLNGAPNDAEVVRLIEKNRIRIQWGVDRGNN